jgi:hypothetical protein
MTAHRAMLLMAAIVAALCSGALGCSPNVVLGTRDRDAGSMVDATAPSTPADAGNENMMMMDMEGMAPGARDMDAGMTMSSEPVADAGRDTGAAPDPTTGDAGECTGSEQCTSADEPFCNVAMAECVECLSDDNCPADEFCEPDGDCETRPTPCTDSTVCAGTEEPVCHEVDRVCVECNTDADCTDSEVCQPDGDCD